MIVVPGDQGVSVNDHILKVPSFTPRDTISPIRAMSRIFSKKTLTILGYQGSQNSHHPNHVFRIRGQSDPKEGAGINRADSLNKAKQIRYHAKPHCRTKGPGYHKFGCER